MVRFYLRRDHFTVITHARNVESRNSTRLIPGGKSPMLLRTFQMTYLMC